MTEPAQRAPAIVAEALTAGLRRRLAVCAADSMNRSFDTLSLSEMVLLPVDCLAAQHPVIHQ